MSFINMNKEELHKAAKNLDVEVSDQDSNKQIVDKLKETNVSYATYRKLYLEGDQPEEFVAAPVLIKMDRKNPSFEAFGYMFTQEHPFVAMSEEEAQKISDAFEGFRLATFSESKKFYG